MKKLVALTSLILCIYAIHAQKDGLLWRIDGNGLKNSSFLFGTIHYHCQPESVNRPAVLNAVKAADQVMFELDLGNMDVLMEMYRQSLIPSGSSLKSILNSAAYKIIDSTCRQYLGDSLISFDNKSPLDLMSRLFLSEKFTGCKGMPVDFTIVQMAKSADKVIAGLETFGFQDSLLKSVPLTLQADWLSEFCMNLARQKTYYTQLTDAYNSQNSEELYRLSFETSPEFLYLKERLIVQRNINWFNFLIKEMPKKSYFIAVGAAHLGGTEGLIALLRKKGFVLTPVKY